MNERILVAFGKKEKSSFISVSKIAVVIQYERKGDIHQKALKFTANKITGPLSNLCGTDSRTEHYLTIYCNSSDACNG
jgi:hypothetical protein